jgi:hypothetical protein
MSSIDTRLIIYLKFWESRPNLVRLGLMGIQQKAFLRCHVAATASCLAPLDVRPMWGREALRQGGRYLPG